MGRRRSTNCEKSGVLWAVNTCGQAPTLLAAEARCCWTADIARDNRKCWNDDPVPPEAITPGEPWRGSGSAFPAGPPNEKVKQPSE